MSKASRKKKETFLLKNIDPLAIEKKYGLVADTPQHKLDQKIGVTPINSLYTMPSSITETKDNFFTFIDESKKFCITMKDSITKERICSQTCYWCRHYFTTVPIGCPIQYVPNSVAKMCKSELTKEDYIVEQSIPKGVTVDTKNFKMVYNDYYETEGSFCSFNCALAYINDQGNNFYYRNSKSLLMKMRMEIFSDNQIDKLLPAPSWKLLREYGGMMDIEQFRNESRNHMYVDRSYRVTGIPKMVPRGNIYEQIFIF